MCTYTYILVDARRYGFGPKKPSAQTSTNEGTKRLHEIWKSRCMPMRKPQRARKAQACNAAVPTQDCKKEPRNPTVLCEEQQVASHAELWHNRQDPVLL